MDTPVIIRVGSLFFRRHLSAGFLRSLSHFFRRYISFVRGEGPAIPERIRHHTPPVSPKRVLNGHHDARTCVDGFLERRVGIRHIEKETHRRVPDRLGTLAGLPGHLIIHHHD